MPERGQVLVEQGVQVQGEPEVLEVERVSVAPEELEVPVVVQGPEAGRAVGEVAVSGSL